MVMIYHFFPRILPGGFIGVDLLFALSGFLIASMAIDQIADSGRFEPVFFLRKRFYRLVPTLLLTVGTTLLLSLRVSSDYRANLGRQLAAVFGFMTNQYEIVSGGTYETQFIPHLFLHTWSLGIELHFYLFWALLLYLLLRFLLKKRKAFLDSPEFSERRMIYWRRRIISRWILRLALAVILLSLVRVYLAQRMGASVASLYFSDSARFYPFFGGVLAACLTGMRYTSLAFRKLSRRIPMRVSAGLYFGSMAVLLILAVLLHYDSAWTYGIGLPLVALVSTVLLLSARVFHKKSRRMKEPLAVTILARSSYGIYLFHWPLAILLKAMLPHWAALLLTVLLSVFMGIFANYIWDPLIAGKPVRIGNFAKKTRIGTAAALACAAFFAISMVPIVHAAPAVTSLEEQMHIGSVEQNIDKMTSAYKRTVEIEEEIERKKPDSCFIIGDSVLLGPRSYLLEHIPESEIDAKGYRNIQAASSVLEERLKTEPVPKDIILACGVNSLDNPEEALERIIDLVPDGHRLIVVTPHDGRATEGWTVTKLLNYEMTIEDKYPFVTLADWHSIAVQHPEYYKGTDGVHFYGIEEAYEAYANMLNDAIMRAKDRPLKGETK